MGDAVGNLWNNLFGDNSPEEPAPAATEPEKVQAPTVEEQAAQRRLARMSKYFTTPTGVLEEPNTGTTGVYN